MLREESDFERNIFEVVAYLVTSARGLLDEPQSYGPLRLIEALNRLIDLPEIKKDIFFNQIKQKLDKRNYLPSRVGVEGVKRFLDELVLDFAREAKKRKPRF